MIPEYTFEEVELHNSMSECWIVMQGHEVFDVSRFINDHPGGAETLGEHCGTDATQAFSSVGHSDDAYRLLQQHKIGRLKLPQVSEHSDEL